MILYDGPGDLFESRCKTLVCPINVAGVMGKGLAKTFRRRYPGLFERYLSCYPRTDHPELADVTRIEVFDRNDGGKVLLLPTKLHWRNPSNISQLNLVVQQTIRRWDELGLESVAFPAIGCGLGELDFVAVRQMLLRYFNNNTLPVEIYHPY